MGRIRSTLKPDQVSGAYAIPPEVEATLSNWGRWAAGREGRVQRHVNQQFTRALRGSRWDPCATAPAVALDVDSAWRVEQTICDPMFSPRFRTLLVEHYAHQRDRRDTCRLLYIPWLAYDAEWFKAAMYCWHRMQQRFSVRPVDSTSHG